MADEPNVPIAPAATPAVEAAPSAPIVETPAPAATETVAPLAEAPVAEPAKVEAPVAAPVEPAKVENVLGETKTEAKPDAKAETETPAEPKVDLPTYEEFKLPENITLEKEPMDAFTKILGKIETGKLDHAGMQSVGQELIDLAAKSTVDSINRYTDSLVNIHQQNQKARFDALKADPDLGGEKLPDTIAVLQNSITEYGGTEAQISEFRKEITEAGLGASPAVCRLIYNMQQKIDKYTKETQNNMVPAARPAPSKVKAYQAFYQGNAS